MEGSANEKFTIENVRDNLVARKRRLESHLVRERDLKIAHGESSNQAEIVDMAQALEQLDRDVTLAEQGHRELEAINAALMKIENGRFGVCEECEERIPPKRLQVMPAARFCADCQAAFEEDRRTGPARPVTGLAA